MSLLVRLASLYAVGVRVTRDSPDAEVRTAYRRDEKANILGMNGSLNFRVSPMWDLRFAKMGYSIVTSFCGGIFKCPDVTN